MASRGTPKGCEKISRWLASEASVTTGEFVSQSPGTPAGVPGLCSFSQGFRLRGFNPWLISCTPSGCRSATNLEARVQISYGFAVAWCVSEGGFLDIDAEDCAQAANDLTNRSSRFHQFDGYRHEVH